MKRRFKFILYNRSKLVKIPNFWNLEACFERMLHYP
ncbi:hypothetical protein ES332_D12G142100v1 [Gossypium tomentosum]|uniref:Uncharacterized protein n=1 Tax=Gossypium tomentosum TaxID=34277 RepID=A0A5D2I958_GOSTO|nr:hypothetical protein ES332_D12G142100v1 [Gossypium tomentosum]